MFAIHHKTRLQPKKKNSLYSRYQMFSTFSGALMFSTTTEIIFRNIHLQCAQGCFACSLFSFTSYIVPSSHVWPRFTAMESLPSLSRETSSQFESSLTTSMRSFVTRLCQPLHDPTPSLTFSTPEPSGIFGRREESSGIDKTTLFACIKIRDLNLFSPP